MHLIMNVLYVIPIFMALLNWVASVDFRRIKFYNAHSGEDSKPYQAARKSSHQSRSHLNYLNHKVDLLSLRGGSTSVTNDQEQSTVSQSRSVPCSVLVSTSLGSSFLDKKKRLELGTNATVLELKQQLQSKFPGSPPAAIQRIFFGVRLLQDDEIVSNLTSALSPIPILLDMMSGTSVYNKTMSISQAIEAYAACTVQQSYIGSKMSLLFNENQFPTTSTDSNLETANYRDMFEIIHQSISEKYADDIALSLEEEKNPETDSADTAAWRGNGAEKNPLAKAFAKEFDLNFRGFKHFAYYSVLLLIFAFFGTTTEISSQFLILMLPVLWISKLRQLRLIYKLSMNLALPILAHSDFFRPLLPAPFQVIGIESAKISSNDVILPISKKKSGKHSRQSPQDTLDMEDEDVDEEGNDIESEDDEIFLEDEEGDNGDGDDDEFDDYDDSEIESD